VKTISQERVESNEADVRKQRNQSHDKTDQEQSPVALWPREDEQRRAGARGHRRSIETNKEHQRTQNPAGDESPSAA